jgi:hypothetical protein
MTTPTHPVTAPEMAGLTQAQALTIPLADPPSIVTVVPLNKNEPGRDYLRHHVYIHDWERPQIRLDTTYLGYSVWRQAQLVVVPVSQWWYIGSTHAIPSTSVAHLAAIMAEPDLHTAWKGSATLMELGGPVAVTLPLGYGQPANGATPAPQGEHSFSYQLDELLKSARIGRTLLDTPKAP